MPVVSAVEVVILVVAARHEAGAAEGEARDAGVAVAGLPRVHPLPHAPPRPQAELVGVAQTPVLAELSTGLREILQCPKTQ